MKHAVQVVLLNEDNEVLAVSRKDDHNDFGLIGGKVDEEDYYPSDECDSTNIRAAIREVKEETGLDIKGLYMFGVFSMHKCLLDSLSQKE